MSIFETLSSEQQSLIQQHLQLVIEANKTVNLTRISTVEEAMVLHVEDSLCGLEDLNSAPEGLYGDLGSGAGYPGIPLAVASGRQTTLVDARKKKMDVMAEIIGQLGISSSVTTFAGRAELLAKTQSRRYSALTARALSQLPVLMELASPLLETGGILLCYKAQLPKDEIADAKQVQALLGMRFVNDRSFMLENTYRRRILAFEKIAEPKIKLPRQEGQAQKHPLTK